MTLAQIDDGYIPLLTRFAAWWEGVEADSLMHKGSENAGGVEQDRMAIEVDVTPDEPGLDWPRARLDFARRLWGEEDEVVQPGGADYTVQLVRPMALSTDHSLLHMTAGLGGGARKVHTELGLWVDAMEPNAELAAEAHSLSVKRQLAKKVPIEAYDPGAMEEPKRKYDGILIRELLFSIADPMAFMKTVVDVLRPMGHLVFTDFVLAEPGAAEAAIVKKWLARERGNPHPMVTESYLPALKKMNLAVRVHEDATDEYRGYVLGGWSRFVNNLTKDDLTRDVVSRMMIEAEYWLYRMRALESGKLRFIRVHAIKKA